MKALALLVALACATPASALEPAIGRFLIAKPQVSGFFAASVIVLVDHGEHGSLGLIVNRPTALPLAEVLPELTERREPAFLGGPVAQDQLLLLVRGEPPPGSARVLDTVHVSGNRDTLKALLAESGAKHEFRAYVGYAGWAPRQLDGEIARGDWLVANGDDASVFTRESGSLWDELFQKHRTIRVDVPGKFITLSAPWRSAAASSAFRTSGRARSSTR